MSLTLELVRAHSDFTSFESFTPGASADPFEKRLKDILTKGKELLPTLPAPANATGSVTLDFQRLYEPLLQEVVQQAIAATQPSNLAKAPFWVVAGKGVRSVLNPEGTGWDPLPGGSIPLYGVTSPFAIATGATLLPDLATAVPPPTQTIVGQRYYLTMRPDGAGDPRERVCTYCFPTQNVKDIQGIVLFFSQTRSEVVSIEALPGGGGGRGPDALQSTRLPGTKGHVFRVDWRRDPDLTGSICVQVRYVGDPPHVRGFTWLTDGPRVEIQAPVRTRGGLPPVPPKAVRSVDAAELAVFDVDFAYEMNARRAAVQNSSASKVVREDMRFFLELEEKSHTRVSAANHDAYAAFGSFLANRYLTRAELYHFRPLGELDAFPGEEAASWSVPAIATAKMMRKLLEKHYPSSSGGIRFRRVAQAFERFGGGELTVFDTHGAPDGANIFCFVELALLLIELDHDRALWERLLPIFGQACEIFTGSYHLCCGPRTHCSYRVAHNPDGARAATSGIKSDVSKRWAKGQDHAAAYDRLVHAALFDDLPQPGTNGLTTQDVMQPTLLLDTNCAGPCATP